MSVTGRAEFAWGSTELHGRRPASALSGRVGTDGSQGWGRWVESCSGSQSCCAETGLRPEPVMAKATEGLASLISIPFPAETHGPEELSLGNPEPTRDNHRAHGGMCPRLQGHEGSSQARGQLST